MKKTNPNDRKQVSTNQRVVAPSWADVSRNKSDERTNANITSNNNNSQEHNCEDGDNTADVTTSGRSETNRDFTDNSETWKTVGRKGRKTSMTSYEDPRVSAPQLLFFMNASN